MTDAPKTIAEPWRSVTFRYTNWRGETATRRAIPSEIFWSATEHHPEPQWIMRALDLDKSAPRDFALKDCDFRAIPLPADDARIEAKHGERIDYTAAQLQAMGEAYAAAYADALVERAVSDDDLVEKGARALAKLYGLEDFAPFYEDARVVLSAMRGEP